MFKKDMLLDIKNSKLAVLILILLVSTLIATFMQFVKGDLFQSAIEYNNRQVTIYIIVFGVMVITEVLFYYLGWLYENRLIKDAFAKQKASIGKQLLNVKDFKNIESVKERKLNVLTNVVDSLENTYYRSFVNVFYLSFRVLFVSIALLYINVYIGVVVIAFMFIPLCITKFFKEKLSALENFVYNQKGKNLDFYKNLMDNLKYMKVFNLSAVLFPKLKKNVEKEYEAWGESKNYQATLNALYSLFSYLSHFIILTISVILIYKKVINPGMVITLLGLVEQLSMPILNLSRSINNINSTKKLRNQIQQERLVEENQAEIHATFNEKLIVKNLHIPIDNKTLIYKDMAFYPQQKYLITGESGTGKSIFLETVLGMNTEYTGTIKYDHHVLNQQTDVFDDMAYILTDNDLLNASVVYNILFRTDYTKTEYDYMKQLLSETVINEQHIDNLSSGEKRRVLLLRGLMSGKSTLIFDEPTAHLDAHTSQKFWQMLMTIQDKTMIIVSHYTPMDIQEQFDFKIDFSEYTERE